NDPPSRAKSISRLLFCCLRHAIGEPLAVPVSGPRNPGAGRPLARKDRSCPCFVLPARGAAPFSRHQKRRPVTNPIAANLIGPSILPHLINTGPCSIVRPGMTRPVILPTAVWSPYANRLRVLLLFCSTEQHL